MSSRLQALQDAALTRLAAYPVLDTLNLSRHNASDTAGLVDEAVTTGIGLSVLVMPPLPERVAPGAPGPVFEEVELRVRVIENPWTNTTGLTALAVAERVSQALHLWQPQLPGWSAPLRLAGRRPWRELRERDNPERYTLEVTLVTSESLSVTP